MRVISILTFAAVCVFFIGCSEDDDQQDFSPYGKLFVESYPPGAAIFLTGTNSSEITPATLDNLEPGNYNGFLYMQYYDTLFFTANISANTTTSLDFYLEDGLPDVDFEFDYYTRYSGDSVTFNFMINQDVLIDSIIVRRPADSTGMMITDIYDYDDKLFEYKDQFGSNIVYYLPPPGSGREYFQRIRGKFYYFSMLGRKAYGAQIQFRIFFQIAL